MSDEPNNGEVPAAIPGLVVDIPEEESIHAAAPAIEPEDTPPLMIRRATWLERLQWLLAWLFSRERIVTADELVRLLAHAAEIGELESKLRNKDLRIDFLKEDIEHLKQDLSEAQARLQVMKVELGMMMDLAERDRARINAEKAEHVCRQAHAELGKIPPKGATP